MKSKTKENPDKIVIKQKKGVWLRFIKLFPKCKLPWIWLIIYIVFDLGVVNLGVSETDYTAQLFSGDTSTALLAKLIAIMIANLVVTNLTIYLRSITSAKINRNMRGVVLKRVMNLPMSFFKDEQPREAIYRIVNNATVIDSTIMLVILPLITAMYTAVTVFGKVFTYDWRLSVILLAFIPLQLFLAVIFGRINFSLNERENALNASLTQKLAELVTNIPLAKAFAKENKEAAKGEEITQRLYKLKIKSSWFDQIRDLSDTVVNLLQTLVLVLVGVVLLRNADITKRAWIAFFLFSSVFGGAVEQFIMYYNNLKIIQGGADRVAEIMDAPEEDKSGETCEKLTGDIKLDDIHFGYEEKREVLRGLTCEFKDNCVTALLGESGCGKTTLINLIMRLYPYGDGTITIDSKPVPDYALEEYRSQFTVVSQNSLLFSGSVRENVCYANKDVSEETFTQVLKMAGAYDFVMEMPEKAETMLEEYANNLSGGQKQRITIARALLSDAHYIILDEPVASMDAVAVSDIMNIFKDFARDKCVIIISHTAAAISIAQRAVIMENGVVSAQGEIEELKDKNDFLRELCAKEVRYEED